MNAPSPTAARYRVDPRLYAMMFLQYAVYGLWLPIAARFLSADLAVGGLGFTDYQIGMIVAVASAIGAIAAPFIAGQIADRYVAPARCLAVMLFAGGVIQYIRADQTSFAAWLWLSIAYAILFMPTISLTNSLALAHLPDAKRQFPRVRAVGTIAWITVAWVFPMVWLQSDLEFRWLPPFFTGQELAGAPGRMIDSTRVAGVVSMAYALFCWFALPHAPPKRDGGKTLAFAKAFGMIRRPSFAVLVIAALMVSVVHCFYFVQMSKFLSAIGLADAYIMPAMSLGQISEILALAVLGPVLARLGFRTVITLGAFCYFLKYALFGTTGLPLEWIVAAQLVHGFSFAFFFAAAFIYVDRIAPPDARYTVQTVFMLVILGIGPLVAGPLNGWLSAWCTPPGGRLDYGWFWSVAAGVGLAVTILVAVLFRDETMASTMDAREANAGAGKGGAAENGS
ncbi:MAG: MFS transporter [Patescibacteria group bacterium]|nr:MFS transporter [Patescibacteria group bacterium]